MQKNYTKSVRQTNLCDLFHIFRRFYLTYYYQSIRACKSYFKRIYLFFCDTDFILYFLSLFFTALPQYITAEIINLNPVPRIKHYLSERDQTQRWAGAEEDQD